MFISCSVLLVNIINFLYYNFRSLLNLHPPLMPTPTLSNVLPIEFSFTLPIYPRSIIVLLSSQHMNSLDCSSSIGVKFDSTFICSSVERSSMSSLQHDPFPCLVTTHFNLVSLRCGRWFHLKVTFLKSQRLMYFVFKFSKITFHQHIGCTSYC